MTRKIACLLIGMVIVPCLGRGGWSTDPGVTTPITAVEGLQIDPVAVTDGAGGMIVAWVDRRSGTGDIYAQHLDGQGNVLWQGNGIPVCVGEGEQSSLRMVPDGAGGAIVAWTDWRGGLREVYANRINGSGTVLWATDGIWVSQSPGTKTLTDMAFAPDGSVVLVWTYTSTTGSLTDVYAQKLNGQGISQWDPEGVQVCGERGLQQDGRLVVSTQGVAIIVWEDFRLGNYDIFMQRLTADGVRVEPDSGRPLCLYQLNQRYPVIVGDGQGGAYVVWEDDRAFAGSGLSVGGGNTVEGINEVDIYATRVNAGGVIFAQNGFPVCNEAGPQQKPRVIPDNDGGAVVAWIDGRQGFPDATVYAQRINRLIELQWSSGGIPLNQAPAKGYALEMVSDGLGGAIVLWEDGRGYERDIYARHITVDGRREWDTYGEPVARGVGERREIRPVEDGRGGALVAFALITEFQTESDIQAQRIDRNGALGDASPRIASVEDVRNDQGGQVEVLWNPSYLDLYPRRDVYMYRVYRGVHASQSNLSFEVVTEQEYATLLASSVAPPKTYMINSNQLTVEDPIYWELMGEIEAQWLEGYALTVATPADSGGDGSGVYYFMVRAIRGTTYYWDSSIDSGYSVDNLAPLPPQNLTASVASGQVHLRWSPNGESDLLDYQIYRSPEQGFALGSLEPLGVSGDTVFVDDEAVAGNRYYAVVAGDIHGNLSPKSNEVALVIQDAGDEEMLPTTIALRQNYPNPFNPTTTIEFALPAAGYATVQIYNLLGEELATLTSAKYGAGIHQIVWDASHVPSGVYVYRLIAGEYVQTRKMVLMK